MGLFVIREIGPVSIDDEDFRELKKQVRAISNVFIEHFKKMYTDPSEQSSKHWKKEMNAWFEKAYSKAIKMSNKRHDNVNEILKEDFFNVNGYEVVSMDDEERKAYLNFVDMLIKDKDVYKAFKHAGIVTEVYDPYKYKKVKKIRPTDSVVCHHWHYYSDSDE